MGSQRNAVSPETRTMAESTVKTVESGITSLTSKQSQAVEAVTSQGIEKTVIVVAVLGVITSIIGLVLAAYLVTANALGHTMLVNYCQTTACRSIGEFLQSTIDRSEDPCKNFYKFACGKWTQKNHQRLDVLQEMMQNESQRVKDIASKTVIPTTGQSAVQKASGMYQRCIKKRNPEAEIQSLHSFIESLNIVWPETRPPGEHQLLRTLIRLALNYQKFIYFEMLVESNSGGQGFITVSRVTERTSWSVTFHRLNKEGKLRKFIADHLIDLNFTTYNFESLIDKIIESENTVLDILTPGVDREVDNSFAISLDTWIRITNENLSPESQISAKTFHADQNVLRIVSLLKEEDDLNYGIVMFNLGWRILLRVGPLVSEAVAYVQNKEEMLKMSYSELCLETVVQYMSHAISAPIFLPQLNDFKRTGTAMVNHIRKSINRTFFKSTVLDDESRKAVVLKHSNIRIKLSVDDRVDTEEKLNTYYSEFPNVGNIFFDYYLKCSEVTANQYKRRLLPLRDRQVQAFIESSFTVDLRHDHLYSAVTVTAAVMQLPVFHSDMPSSLNYGGLGQMVAHENMHAVDPSNIKEHKNGKPKQLLSPSSTAKYASSVSCLSKSHEQYKRQTLVQSELYSDNIADHAALPSLYRAFTEAEDKDFRLEALPEYTGEKLFFIAVCMKLCSAVNSGSSQELRCNLPLMQVDAFAKAFSCAEDSVMNPKEKCSFW